MAMMIKRIKSTFQKIGFYLPFTFYFLLFVAGCALALTWIDAKQAQPDTSFSDILDVLLKVAMVFGAAFLALGFMSALISYGFLLWQKKKGNISFAVATNLLEADFKNKKVLEIKLHPILKTLLVSVKMLLHYDDTHYSQKFSIVEKKQRWWLHSSIEGTYYWPVPSIKEYHISKAIIYFEDLFQFFSFAIWIETNNRFIKAPDNIGLSAIKSMPRKTEESNIKIDDMRKVEGEYLNYKNFEDNDDVRRIVWKVYARNKELVVRTPETMDPYASHLYMYASFHSIFAVQGNDVADIPFLNYYKNYIWSVYQQLGKQQYEVKFIPDQDSTIPAVADPALQVKNSISTSNWHSQKDITNYCKPNDASILIISSFSDVHQVENLLNIAGNSITIIFVKLSNCLQKQKITDWMQWIFTEQEKDATERYKTGWSLSPLRIKVNENEKQLQQLLNKYQYPVFA